jgi:formylglycine-generating enzyme required for sulfatase activity
MVWIDGGAFTMGSNDHYPEETPAHRVEVDEFWIDRSPVTNAEFARFVSDTGQRTVAEQVPDPADYPNAIPEMLVAASTVFVSPRRPVDLTDPYNWWTYIPGADWRHPSGPHSTIEGLQDHPVVHVAWNDVVAYAAWAGKEVPTEVEWEFAARGGLIEAEFAWGDEFLPSGTHQANTWQGPFPYRNDVADGYARTSPVGAFPPNGYGILDMIGNVLEWTDDWYADHVAAGSSCCAPQRPPQAPDHRVSNRTKWCRRYHGR